MVCSVCSVPVPVGDPFGDYVKMASEVFHLPCFMQNNRSVRTAHNLSLRLNLANSRIEFVSDGAPILSLDKEMAATIGRDLIGASIKAEKGAIAPATRQMLDLLTPTP